MDENKEIKFDKGTEETKPIQTKEVVEKETTNKEKIAQEMGLMIPKTLADQITNTMTNYTKNGLVMPKDYNYQNAIISSYLIIKQDEKLNSCTKDSIANALVDMATLGLNASKNQCYFVPYAGKLQLQSSYFGKITSIRRIKGVIDVRADVIYKGTDYELEVDDYGNDTIKILKSCPLEERSFENIIGAWAKVILDENIWGSKSYTCIMTLDQIHKAWNQGATKGKSPAHTNFTDEMCKKTVINRCCKGFVNSAKDQDIFIETLNRTISNEYEEEQTSFVKPNKVIDI